ncbi:MAG: hypothetical protein ACI8R4_004361 [Paracoccaceae bacterium]|jgi:hypothetical protein
MKQSRTMSLVEAIANVIVGYGVAVATQILVLAWFGVHMSLTQNLNLAATFTLISIIRSFALRRVFESIRSCKDEREAAAPVRRQRLEGVVFRREFCKPDHDHHPSRR